MRIGTPHIAACMQSAIELLDAQGVLPPGPEVFGNRSITELLDEGTIQLNVAERYPQAIGISNIETMVDILGNSMWDVMFVNPIHGAFLTSDFPVGLGPSYDNRIVSKTVPLAPDIAIRIHPNFRERGKKPDFSFPRFRARLRELRLKEMCEVNRQPVRAAETMVFCNVDADWLVPFVRKNRDFRVESVVSEIPWPSAGKMIIATQRIVPYARSSRADPANR
jgi:hypothetical protein